MVNLLTVFEKKRILKEYKMRLCVVSLFATASLIVAAIVFLMPSYVLSYIKYNEVSTGLEAEKNRISNTPDGEDPVKITKDINSKLKILKGEPSTLPDPYFITTTIIKHKPDGVFINAIQYDKNKQEGKIAINGVSSNRDTLLVFLRALEKQKDFTKVELPISSFAKGEDIGFSMRITIEDVAAKREQKNENEK